MKSSVFVASVILLSVALQGQRGEQGAPGARIDVVVLDAISLTPIPGARLTLRDFNEKDLLRASTGTKGEAAALTGIASGRYLLYGEHVGHLPLYFGQSDPDNPPTWVTVGSNALRLEMILTRASTVSGRILDRDNRPLADGEVFLMRVRYAIGGIVGQRFLSTPANIQSVQTNDEGSFRFAGVPPGEYYVRVSPAVQAETRGPIANHSLRTYYPGVTSPDQAAYIEVPMEGTDRTGVDFRVDTAPRFRISGRIVYPQQPPDETPLDPPAFFYLVSSETRYARIVDFPSPLRDRNEARDAFDLVDVPPGTYDLFIGSPSVVVRRPTGAPTFRPGYSAHAVVNLLDRDVDGLTLVLEPGVDIKGQVKLDSSAQALKPDLRGFQPMFFPLDGRPTLLAQLFQSELLREDGTFELRNAPLGEYRLSIVFPTLYVKAAWLGPRNILGLPFTLDKTTEGPLVLELSGDGARFNGSVLDTSNKPVADAQVILVPPMPLRGDFTAYRRARTNRDGQFSVTTIRPGSYTVFPFREIPESAWLNEEYMSRYRVFGTSINFVESTEIRQDLRAIDKPR